MYKTIGAKAKRLASNKDFVNATGFDNADDIIQLLTEVDLLHYYEDYFGNEGELERFDAMEKLKASAHFSTFGYSKDYSVDGKYIGSETLEEADRDTYGYYGRREETLTEDKKFKNKPIIKAGTVVRTELFPLNGRIIKK